MTGQIGYLSQFVSRSTVRRNCTFVCGGAVLLAASYFCLFWWVSHSAPRTLVVAEERLKSRDNAGVEQSLSWLLWFNPENYRALLLRGISRNARKDNAGALEDLSGIPTNRPEFREGGVALAATLISDGQLQRAEQVLLDHLMFFPGEVTSRDRLSDLYVSLLCHPEALHLWDDHWLRFPADLSVLPRMFDIRTEVVSPPQRLPYLSKVNLQHPGQERVLAALGILHGMSANSDLAETCFGLAVQSDDCHPGTLISAACFFVDAGEFDRGKSLLNRYSRTSEARGIRAGQYWSLIGRSNEAAGDLEGALEAFRNAVRSNPEDPAYQLSEAAALRRLGRLDEARTAAQHAQQLSEATEQLRVLSQKIDRDRPDSQGFLEVSKVFSKLGKTKEAFAWKAVSDSLNRSDKVE